MVTTSQGLNSQAAADPCWPLRVLNVLFTGRGEGQSGGRQRFAPSDSAGQGHPVTLVQVTVTAAGSWCNGDDRVGGGRV